MAIPKISSIFSSKAVRIAIAAGIVFTAPNVWLAWHADRILNGDELWQPIFLEHRMAELEHRERVQVIVLGNSHAMASLRPHQVASALGLPEGSVVSFAMPGASAWEMRLLLERYAPNFPQVNRVICGVDPYLVAEDLGPRARYLTRRSWWDRWDYSQRHPDLETKARLLVGWFFPVGDFSISLKSLAKASPRGALKQFVTLERQPLPRRDFPSIAYAWGIPLSYDYVPDAALKKVRAQAAKKGNYVFRANQLLGRKRDLGPGLNDLDRLLGTLKGRYAHVHLVEPPFASGLDTMLSQHFTERQKTYRQALEASLDKHGLTVLPAPKTLADADFYDLDHLTPEGGKKYLGWLATKLKGASARLATRTSPAP